MNALRMALLSVIVLVSGSRIAMADTTKLICQQRPGGGWHDEQPMIVELNEAQKTVITHIPPRRLNEFRVQGTTQTLPANFGKDKIIYGNNVVLNRLTGDLSDGNGYYWTCQVGKPQF